MSSVALKEGYEISQGVGQHNNDWVQHGMEIITFFRIIELYRIFGGKTSWVGNLWELVDLEAFSYDGLVMMSCIGMTSLLHVVIFFSIGLRERFLVDGVCILFLRCGLSVSLRAMEICPGF